MNKRATGNIGEELAVEFLIKKGFKIIQRNYHCRFSEIDIIASKNGLISFFEVKYRTYSHKIGVDFPVESAVTQVKKARLLAAIQYWLGVNSYEESVIDGIYLIYILNKFNSNVVKMVQLAL